MLLCLGIIIRKRTRSFEVSTFVGNYFLSFFEYNIYLFTLSVYEFISPTYVHYYSKYLITQHRI